MRRDIEAHFRPLQNCRRQLLFHQLLQDYFLLRAANLQGSGELGGKLDNAVIQKWRSHFDRMRHAHAVALRQNVIRQIISLVQPEIRRKVIAGSRKSIDFAEDSFQRTRQRLSDECFLLGIGKSAVPVDVSARRLHQCAFQKALYLVFKTDFVVRDGPIASCPKSRSQKRAGQNARSVGERIRAVGQVAAKELVGTLSAQSNRGFRFAEL